MDTYHRKWTLTLFDTVWFSRRWSSSLTTEIVLAFHVQLSNAKQIQTCQLIYNLHYHHHCHNHYHHYLTFEFMHCLFSSLFPWWNMVKLTMVKLTIPEANAVLEGFLKLRQYLHKASRKMLYIDPQLSPLGTAMHGYARIGRHGTFRMKRWQHLGFWGKT